MSEYLWVIVGIVATKILDFIFREKPPKTRSNMYMMFGDKILWDFQTLKEEYEKKQGEK